MYNKSAASKDRAYIIHQRPYQDSHAIIELFSLNNGRISTIRKGVRSSKTRKQYIYQSFIEQEVSIKFQKNSIKIDKIVPTTGLSDLPVKYLRLGLYLNELIYRLLEVNDPHPTVYTHYQQAIQSLSTNSAIDILRQFELSLFSQMGYEVPFHQLTQTTHHRYDLTSGFIPSPSETPTAFSTASLKALGEGNYHRYAMENKAFIRHIVSQLLSGQTLKSYELYV